MSQNSKQETPQQANSEQVTDKREQFAKNMEYLFDHFKRTLSVDDLADVLKKDTSTVRRYIRGDTTKLSRKKENEQSKLEKGEDAYPLVATYMVENICKDNEYILQLGAFIGLSKDELDPFQLDKNEDMMKKVCRKMELSMRHKDFKSIELAIKTEANANAEAEAEAEVEVEAEGEAKVEAEVEVEEKKSRCKKIESLKIFWANHKIKNVMNAVFLVAFLGAALYCRYFIPAAVPPPRVTLNITHYSSIGEKDAFVTGTVTVSHGDSSDYAVTMALVSPSDSRIYAPKPSRAFPSVDVTHTEKRETGNFTCVFAVGAHPDIYADKLYVYVVPADFVPDEDVDRTKRAAVAYEELNRK